MPERDDGSLTLDKGGLPSTTCRPPVSRHAICRATAGIGETNYGVKDLFLPFLGIHRSVFTCGDVAKNCAVSELNVLEAKAGDGGFVGSDSF